MNMNTAISCAPTLSPLSTAGEILHAYQDLIVLFNTAFTETENTVLVKGNSEPIYIPAKKDSEHHQVVFAHGYFASAMDKVNAYFIGYSLATVEYKMCMLWEPYCNYY